MRIFSKRKRLCGAVASATLLFQPYAYADVFGRLSITIKNIDDEAPVAGAKVILHDLGNIRPDIVLTTDKNGEATSPLLENRSWQVIADADKFSREKKTIKVVSDSTSSLDLSLEPVETTIKVTGTKTLLKRNDTSNATSRGSNFNKAFPVSASSPQQLTGLLLSNPGFVQDSNNQVHPRGEHSATSIYIQGYQLGGAAQGRFGPILDPQTLENLDIMTGSFAPEYAGGAAILNSSIRSGTAKPFSYVELGGGSYDTGSINAMTGGQIGNPIGIPDADGIRSKEISYFLSGTARSTDLALEAPQPGAQSAHNHGTAQNFLGRFDYNPSSSDTVSLIASMSPAETQVANRTGLPEKFAPYGQGYGFGGALSAEDAAKDGIISQDKAGQDIYQEDENNLGLLQWRHEISQNITSVFSIGGDRSKLDTYNNNPDVDRNNLPEDSSIEYNPTVTRDAKHTQIATSLSAEESSHTLKFGGQYVDESAKDSYQLQPESQLAVNALYAADPRLVGNGTVVFDNSGNPVLDSQGNQVYRLAPNATAPRLDVDSDGFYGAVYAQDTWKMLEEVTANYGLRYDRYRQTQNQGKEGIDEDLVSPRINLAYSFYPTWMARTSYNKLFIEPPLSQGALIGQSIKPEKLNQYDVSIEKELTPRQKAKVSYYVKDIKDQVDTGLLIPSTQLGLYTSVNLDEAAVHGLELSYELLPDEGFGTSGFISYAYSTARPSGFDNTGEAVDAYNDHDQRHTLSAGSNYTFVDKSSLGLSAYYGTGTASSVYTEDGPRHARSRIDMTASSDPNLLFGLGGIRFTVSNLLDERSVINYNSAFSGTRFQQAQTFVVSTFFNF